MEARAPQHFAMAMALQHKPVEIALAHVTRAIPVILATSAQITMRATQIANYHVLAQRIAVAMAMRVESSGTTNSGN